MIDETSCRKWGDHTPGVQRQYLGCVGKIDNGIVTVHVGVARGTVPGPAGRRPVPAEVVGRRPRPVPGGRHPGRRAVPAEVAARGGPVGPAERERGVVRLAGVRRGVRVEGPAPAVPEPGRPAVRGRGAGQLRRPGRGRRAGPAGGRPADRGGRPGRAAAPAGPPDGAGLVLAGGDGGGVGGRPGAHPGGGRQRGDGGGEVLPDQRDDRPAGAGAGRRLPPVRRWSTPSGSASRRPG